MTGSIIEFKLAFEALTEYSPLRWQCRLFDQLKSGQIPSLCDLPTGLGKTSVIPIWLISLAWQAQERRISLPRRIVYIVNRRTVVDQATTLVEQIRQRLLEPENVRGSDHSSQLRTLASVLRSLSSSEDLVLAVSTLRGELADNQEWKADPARPSIIIGTIDMIGSKLLFSGYGDGRYWRAQHAGLIGQDSLIVHDEAHLTPSFGSLLHDLAAIQRRDGEPRPVSVMELSATSRNEDGLGLQLQSEDEQDAVVRQRLDAKKWISLVPVEIDKQDTQGKIDDKMVKKIIELCLGYRDSRSRILVYIRTPEVAQKIHHLLKSQLRVDGGDNRCALLTGTIRGYERDNLVRQNCVYAAFLNTDIRINRTLYLVSTSAGEVGIDIDADHMVCDVSSLDSIIQRLGRVNRRGGPDREAQVDIVIESGTREAKQGSTEFDEAIKSTQSILREWADMHDGRLDLSPRKLRELVDDLDQEIKERAFAPKPPAPVLTDVLLDAWSLTSVPGQMPGRPSVAHYLHGLENSPPETSIVWRKEVMLLRKAALDEDSLGEWFRSCRIESRESLRDRTDRVKKFLEALLKEHRKKGRGDFPVVVLDQRGHAEWQYLSSIVGRDFKLAYRIVVLPAEAGGLDSDGALNSEVTCEANDVAEFREDGGVTGSSKALPERGRWLLTEDIAGGVYRRLQTDEETHRLPPSWKEQSRLMLQAPAEDGTGGGRVFLILAMDPRRSVLENAEMVKVHQTLDSHLEMTATYVSRISKALDLPREIEETLISAAQQHDCGKNRPIWQQYACNPQISLPVAKSVRYMHPRYLGGYRHELGSLLEAETSDEIVQHPENDLVLHLIASHHGWARPHFGSSSCDKLYTTSHNEQAFVEVMRRFGRLQRRFGRWGLAWLESLVRCADMAASLPNTGPAICQEVEHDPS